MTSRKHNRKRRDGTGNSLKTEMQDIKGIEETELENSLKTEMQDIKGIEETELENSLGTEMPGRKFQLCPFR